MIDHFRIITLSLLVVVVSKSTAFQQLATSQAQFSNNEKYLDFMTSGLKRLFWSFDWNNSLLETNSTNKCLKSVVEVQNELRKGSSIAFSMVDASSSTPSGFLTGSFAALGDFDQCLKVKSSTMNMVGKYCLIEISHNNSAIESANDAIEVSFDSLMPLLDFFLPRMSICVPSTCTQSQVLDMVKLVMSSYPFEVTEKITCQVKSLQSTLTMTQVISICFLFLMFTLSFIATVYKKFSAQTSTFCQVFSLQCNFQSLFYRSNSQVTRNRAIDVLKIVFSLMFISMHAIGGTDNPFSPLLLAKMANALEDSSRPELQIFFSENLAEIMFLLTGYVTVTSVVVFLNKLTIKRSSLALFVSFMFSKWLRTTPLVFTLLALEFVWPLLSTGPFYPETSKFIVTNCYNYWWSNVFLIANWFPSIEKCCPQLFHSCVDFQLALIAIALILILSKSTQAGLLTAFTLSFMSMLKLYHNALTYSVVPNYVSNGASLMQRMQYIDVIQLPTYSHVPAYILGVLCAYKSIMRKEIFIPKFLAKIATRICYTLTAAAIVAPVLHNSTNLLPKSLVPLYIVLQKLFYVSALLPMLLPLRQGKMKDMNDSTNVQLAQVTCKKQFDFVGGIASLTFCSYLINFYVIRYDFMTARIPFEPGMYSAAKRFVFSVVSTYTASLIFYLLFAGPFEQMRRLLIDKLFFASVVKREEKTK